MLKTMLLEDSVDNDQTREDAYDQPLPRQQETVVKYAPIGSNADQNKTSSWKGDADDLFDHLLPTNNQRSKSLQGDRDTLLQGFQEGNKALSARKQSADESQLYEIDDYRRLDGSKTFS